MEREQQKLVDEEGRERERARVSAREREKEKVREGRVRDKG